MLLLTYRNWFVVLYHLSYNMIMQLCKSCLERERLLMKYIFFQPLEYIKIQLRSCEIIRRLLESGKIVSGTGHPGGGHTLLIQKLPVSLKLFWLLLD